MHVTYRVSIITPSLNQGRFIERTICSVLDQPIGDLEYLVFDGGSQDGTLDILRRYETRLRWVSEKDRGQAHAVNKGLQQCTGDIIGWLNSDDVYYPGKAAMAAEFLASRPEIDVLYGDANHIDENGALIEQYPTEAWDLERLMDVCYLCQPAVFFRRRVIERFGVLNEKLHFCLDYEYWLRLALGGARFGRMEEVVAGSRLYAETKTLGSRVRVHREINHMFRTVSGRVPDRWLFNYAHAVLDERGVPRTAALRFPVLVAFTSIVAAIRWNRRISPDMFQLSRSWIGGAVQNVLPRWVKR